MTPDDQHEQRSSKLSRCADLNGGRFDDVIRRFEQAWFNGDRPQIEQYLVENSDDSVRLLVELAHADLEFRLRATETARVEDYLAQFPALAAVPEHVLGLARTELRIRRLLGEDVSAGEYEQRFPQLLYIGDVLNSVFAEDDVKATRTLNPSARPPGSGLRIRCPHCHNPIELVPDAPLDEVECPSCGSHFSLTGRDIATRAASTITRISQFELIDRLGMGAFGTVWKARDTELGRTVAVKVPRRGSLDSIETEKFLREARSMAQLRHPNIVPVHEVGRENGTLYIVSDFIRGVPLSEMMADSRMSFREAVKLLIKVAGALHHAHEKGIIHRDLKPQNIMIDDAGEPHLMDFGLAKREAGEVTMTCDGEVLGTPAYMSPEQARGESHKVDRTSDLYSLGVILFQLLTGELPFRGTAQMLIHKVINDEPPSPRRLDNRVPKDLETVCLKAMAKEPRRRYQTACALSEDLQCFLDGKAILARPLGNVERLMRWCTRNPTTAALTAAVVLLILAGTGTSTLLAISYARARNRAETARKDSVRHEQEAITQAKVANETLSFLIDGILSRADPEIEPSRDITLREAVDRAAQNLINRPFESLEVDIQVRTALGKVFFGLGEYTRSRDLFSEVYQIARENLGESHPAAMTALDQLGKAYIYLEEFADAERVLRNAYELQMRSLGPEHEDTVHSYAKLGDLYWKEGKLHQALEITKKVLAIRRRLWGDEYESTLVSMNGLGLLYLELDRPEESLVLFEQAEQIARRTLGENHTSTLVYKHNRALACTALKRWSEARTLFSECLSKNQEVLGINHLGTLQSEFCLARVLYNVGEFDEARERFDSILARLGPGIPRDHSFRGAVLLGLGKCLTALDEYQLAEETLQDAGALLRKLGPSHQLSRAASEAIEELNKRKARAGSKKTSRTRISLPHSVGN